MFNNSPDLGLEGILDPSYANLLPDYEQTDLPSGYGAYIPISDHDGFKAGNNYTNKNLDEKLQQAHIENTEQLGKSVCS